MTAARLVDFFCAWPFFRDERFPLAADGLARSVDFTDFGFPFPAVDGLSVAAGAAVFDFAFLTKARIS